MKFEDMNPVVMLVVAVLFIGAFWLGIIIFQALWNWLMTDIFSLKSITFWESAGLLLFLNYIRGVRVKE